MKHTHKWYRYGLVEIDSVSGPVDVTFYAASNIARAWYRGWVCLGCGAQGYAA